MRLARHAVLLLGVALTLACRPAERADEGAAAAPDPNPVVVFETSNGRVVMQLDREKAPETVKNFLAHVRSGFYDGLVVHRVDRQLGVIQAGAVTAEGRERKSSVFPIVNEADNGLKNVRGAVAMARTMDPHSATSQFFINLEDNLELDFSEKTVRGWGYAVFGRVIEGMEVVEAIGRVPTRRQGAHANMPVEPVTIRRASIAPADSVGT